MPFFKTKNWIPEHLVDPIATLFFSDSTILSFINAKKLHQFVYLQCWGENVSIHAAHIFFKCSYFYPFKSKSSQTYQPIDGCVVYWGHALWDTRVLKNLTIWWSTPAPLHRKLQLSRYKDMRHQQKIGWGCLRQLHRTDLGYFAQAFFRTTLRA